MAKSFKGKVLTKKRTAKVVSRKEESTPCDLMTNIEHFADGRLDDGPMVISCDNAALQELVAATTEPCLVVPSSDLNNSSFGKELGNCLLEDKSHIFFGTSALSQQGKERLQMMINEMKILFDNRIRIILYGNTSLDELSEKRFEKESFWSPLTNTPKSVSVTPKSSKRQRLSSDDISSPALRDSCFPREIVTRQELVKARNDLAVTLKQKEASDLRVQELEKKVADMTEEHRDQLKKLTIENRKKEQARAEDIEQRVEQQFSMKVKELEEKNIQAMTEINLLQEKLESVQRHNFSLVSDFKQRNIDKDNAARKQRETEDKLEKLEEQNKVLETKISDLKKVVSNAESQTEEPSNLEVGNSTVNMKHKSCQTKKVDIQLSPLSLILQRIEASNRSYLTSVRVCSSIKNFSYIVNNVPDENGSFKCKITITRGTHIMSYKNLLQFEGSGEKMSNAKEDAFETLIKLMRQEAEN